MEIFSKKEIGIIVKHLRTLISEYDSCENDEKIEILEEMNLYGRILLIIIGIWARHNNYPNTDAFKKSFNILEDDYRNGLSYITEPTINAMITIIESLILDE